MDENFAQYLIACIYGRILQLLRADSRQKKEVGDKFAILKIKELEGLPLWLRKLYREKAFPFLLFVLLLTIKRIEIE